MDNTEEKYFLTRGKAILFGLILILIVSVIIFIKYGGSNKIEKYTEFENELKDAAINYVYINNVELDEGEEKQFMMKDILKVYSTDNKLKNKCNGYVIVSSEKDIATSDYDIVYRSYIKCGNKYMTPNYSEY